MQVKAHGVVLFGLLTLFLLAMSLASAQAQVNEGSEPVLVNWSGVQWVLQDFNVQIPGSATIKDGALILSSSGYDIWSTKDRFAYLYQKVSGNFTASVRLHEVPKGNIWTKGGIMVRAQASLGSPQTTIMGTHQKGVRMQYRISQDGESVTTKGQISDWVNGNPIYLKVVRKGTEVVSYASYDSNEWTTIDRVRIELEDDVLVGLALSSHISTELGEAVFTEWTFTNE